MAMFNLPGIFIIIPISLYTHKIGLKLLGQISLVLVIAGSILLMSAQNFVWLLVGRLIIGIGGSTLIIVGLQSVALWFMRYRTGLAMGIYSCTLPLAAIVALNSFGAIGLTWGWQTTIFITTIICFITLILFSLFYQNPQEETSDEKTLNNISLKSIFKIGWNIWLLSITWGLFNLGLMGLMTFLPDFIYSNQIALNVAGSVSSIVMLCALVFSPLVGHLLDRTRYKELYNVVGAFLCFISIFLLPQYFQFLILIVFLIGMFTTPVGPVVFSIIPVMAKRHELSLAYGITGTFSYIGMFAGPALTGFIFDINNSYLDSFWFASFIFLLIAVLTLPLFIKNVKDRRAEL